MKMVLTLLSLVTFIQLNAAPRDARECVVRNGLPNFYFKCNNKKTVKVAYFGGSITAQPGWRVQSLDLFRKQFPQTVFEEIYAPIGGTDSLLGAFRLKRDVTAHKPDLVFVEFAANDGGRGSQTNSIEGIVRNLWNALPECDICFVYTVFGEEPQKALENGKTTEVVAAYEKVADHYGIPSIHMGVEAAKLAKEGKLIWKSAAGSMQFVAGKELNELAGMRVDAKGRIPFAPDGVHPYLDTGHKLYTQAIARSLPKIEAVGDKQSSHTVLPVPLGKFVGDVDFFDVGMVVKPGQWEKLEDLEKHFPGREDLRLFVPSVWRGTPGASMSFRFSGCSLMIYVAAGPGTGMMEVRIDGNSKKYRVFDSWSGVWRLRPFLLLKNHDPQIPVSVTITALGDMLDKRDYMARINRERQFDANPAAFAPNDLYLCGILIEEGRLLP